MGALKPSIRIWIPGKPITKENSFGKGKSGQLFKQKKYVDWEGEVHTLALEAMMDAGWPGPWGGSVGIMANFRFNTFTARDIPNYWKSLLDALNGVVYDDDSQIDFTAQTRQKSSEEPGIELLIYFYDFSTSDFDARNRPREWRVFDVEKVSAPNFYEVIYDPADARPCRFTRFGIGSQAEKREERKAERKREKACKVDNHAVKDISLNERTKKQRPGSRTPGKSGKTRKQRSARSDL